MTEPYIEITHRDQYLELTGLSWPTREEMADLADAPPVIEVPGWPGDCLVMFLPGGQTAPAEQVGRVLVLGPNRTLPARVFEREFTRGRWSTVSSSWDMYEPVAFDTLAKRLAAL